MIGTGEQAETQVLNLAASMRPERIVAASRAPGNREAFMARLAAAGCSVEVVASAEEAVRGADVVCLATTSREPVIQADWVRPGAHINAIGANVPTRREVDTALVRAAWVVVEYRPRRSRRRAIS
jgi:ornithine cyclodeaminase/alanine dehydrogenase-like protein (mu-crystallin family)